MFEPKWFTVYRQVGPTHQRHLEQTTVRLSDVSELERITPVMARQAATLAFGEDRGAWVFSTDDVGYALYPNSHRELERRDLERYTIEVVEEAS